jgi:hypothetical protein
MQRGNLISRKSIRLNFFGLAEGRSIHPSLEDLELLLVIEESLKVI